METKHANYAFTKLRERWNTAYRKSKVGFSLSVSL